MSQGYQEEAAKAEAPRKAVVKKIMAFCLASDEFMMEACRKPSSQRLTP